MDKETLSNYGWIVICVLVLAVMIALATPFGKFVSQAVQSTTNGLFGVNQKALGVAGITIANQTLDVDIAIAGSATFSDGVTLSWEELKLEENGTKYRYNASAISDTEIGESAFNNCTALNSVTIPSSVTDINYNAFYRCDSLKSVVFEKDSQLTTIHPQAFRYCTSLESITIPERVTTINRKTFEDCSSLKSVDLNNCTSIDSQAFQDCTSLESITIPSSVTYISTSVFRNCSALTSIMFENSTTWYYGDDSPFGFANKTEVDVTNPADNAINLVSTYYTKTWVKQ